MKNEKAEERLRAAEIRVSKRTEDLQRAEDALLLLITRLGADYMHEHHPGYRIAWIGSEVSDEGYLSDLKC